MPTFALKVDRVIRLVIGIAALIALSDVGQAQLLIQVDDDKVEQAAKVLPELAPEVTLHFMERSSYLTGGDEVAMFRLCCIGQSNRS